MANDVQKLATELLPQINSAAVRLQFNTKTAKIELVGSENLIQTLTDRAKLAKSFIYQESDRQDIRRLRADVNKFKKAIQAEISAQKSHVFDDIDTQKKDIFEQLDDIIATLDEGMDQFDRQLKAQKKQELTDQFDAAKQAAPELAQTELTYDDVANHRWTNRSFSQTKAVKELNTRLSTLMSLLQSPALADEDVSFNQVLTACQYQDWDGLQAQNYLLNEIKEAKEAEARAKAQAELERQMEADRKRAEAEAEAKRLQEAREQAGLDPEPEPEPAPDVTLTVHAADADLAVDLLTKAGIWVDRGDADDA